MRKNLRLILILCLIKFILPYLLQSHVYEPHRDELLYLAQAHHLAWGYFEIPPFLSVFAWLTDLFGNGMFWIKFWPDLFGVFTFYFTARIVENLGGGKFAIFLAFLPFVFGAYLRVFFLFQPNAPEVFFWTLISYAILRYIQTGKNKYLYFMGISIGLGMLSKYSVAFFVVSIFAGLLLSKERIIFKNKHFYFSCIIAGIIFLPTFLWEFNHDFPVVVHMRQLNKFQLQYVTPVDFVKGQLMMFLPCLFIWLTGLYFTGISFKGKKFRPFAWSYIFVIILLLILHGKFYYTLGAYPMLFGFGAYRLEKFSEQRSKIWRLAFSSLPIITGIPFLPIMLPIARPAVMDHFYKAIDAASTGMLKWEDLKNHPLPQDFADMLGWKEMAKKASIAYNSLDGSEKTNTFLFCDNYGEAGALMFYGSRYGLPEAHSDNGSFLLWLPKKDNFTNLILVTDDKHEMEHPFVKDFTSVPYIDSVTNPYAREHGSLIILFKGANNAFFQMFKKKIQRDISVYK
jgi:Dolichyl-phosphate-mannose-protein mannosyltransferase